MFKSIRWRIVIVYFLLLYLSMVMVGFFIITQFEKIQLDNNSKNTNIRVAQIYAQSSAMKENDWLDKNTEAKIQTNLNQSIQIGYNESLYIIANDAKKTVVASSKNAQQDISAYDIDVINDKILVKSFLGSTNQMTKQDEENKTMESHITYPVLNDKNEIKGYIYLINDISYIYQTVNKSKVVLTRATALVLLGTVVLGLILSKTITGPIKDLTANAKQMSTGDFEHKVSIKSNDEIGQLGEAFNYLTDELTKSMSKIKQEKSKMETTLTYMTDGVMTVDKQGVIVQINPIARRIISSRVKDTNYNEAISKVTDKLSLETIEHHNWTGSYTLNIDEETYKIDYAPYKDGNSEIDGVILVFKNITEQVKMDMLQKEFVANVSHELKTPITTIKSYTETLLEGAMDEKEIANEFLTVINSESDRMTRLVRDLLKLSRMDYEKDSFNKEILKVNEIVDGAYKKLVIQANAQNIVLSKQLDSRNSLVEFDRDGLEQIVLNILSNAIKYTPDGGKVNMSVSSESKNVEIKISDNGIGIPAQDLGRVFDRFYRVDKARTRKMGGTGLGLSIAQEIAKAHDSIIEVKSELNVGTTFVVKIPKHKK